MNLPFLPYGRQSIDDDDIRAVVDVLKGDWLTTGPAVDAFEKALGARCGASDVVAVANGTAALHLAGRAFDLGPGDAAIVPAITFLATANAVRLLGAEVVFADVDPESGLMTERTCREAVARAQMRVRAILPVHLGGRLADMEAIATVARDLGAAVVEDACHALGAAHHMADGGQRNVGACAYSDVAVFSFHPVKTITAGEGGAVACRSPDIAARLRRLRSHGIERDPAIWSLRDQGFAGGEPNPWYYEMPELGWNYRLTDLQCALAHSQLAKLDRFLNKRRFLAEAYDCMLAPLANLVRPVSQPERQDGGWHLYQIAVDFAAIGIGRGALMRRLHAQGIGTQVHYIPLHRQPYYRHRYGDMQLPGAERFYANTLSLPFFPAMEFADVERVVSALSAIVRK